MLFRELLTLSICIVRAQAGFIRTPNLLSRRGLVARQEEGKAFGKCAPPTLKLTMDSGSETLVVEKEEDYGRAPPLALGLSTEFMCERLSSTCKAPETTVSKCREASKMVKEMGDKNKQAAVEKFNELMSSLSSKTTGSATGNSTSSNSGGSTGSAPDKQPDKEDSGGNLQKYTGKLGNILAPEVTKGGKGFKVGGNEFKALNVALMRSCDKQHNKCADKANAPNGDKAFTVGACDKQNEECKQAIGASKRA